MSEFLIARNPDGASTLPYLVRLPLAGGHVVLKVRDMWPRTAKVYCHQTDGWPDDAEIVEVVFPATLSCAARTQGTVRVRNRGTTTWSLAGRYALGAVDDSDPFFTTDTAACLRGIEINADIVIKATKVDGIYSADPVKDPSATKYDLITFDEVLTKQLAVMDLTAMCLCRDHNMPLRVFNMNKPGALLNLVVGEPEGTLVTR